MAPTAEPGEHGAVRAVSAPGRGERPEQLHLQALRHDVRGEGRLPKEGRRAHRTYRVRELGPGPMR